MDAHTINLLMLEVRLKQAFHDVISVFSFNNGPSQPFRPSGWPTLTAPHVETVLPSVVPRLMVELSQEGARRGVHGRDGDIEGGLLFVPLLYR